jgi:sugar (pentulose or hexulose) kinase
VTRGELLAGVDVGTTSVKVLLMAPDGNEVAAGRAPTVWEGGVGGSEADPQAFRHSAVQALTAALEDVPHARVTAVGVASMAESGVLVDAQDQPLAKVIAWHDTRDVADLQDLIADLGAERFSRITGLPLWTQWSLTKHRWLTRRLPTTRHAKRRYNIAEWVARGLGAAPVTELSLASRTGWLDLASGTPWHEAMTWSGASPSMLGELVSAGQAVGRVPGDHPLGQLRGATVTIAGHDHQAAVVGAGALGDNDELDSCGTAEALLRTVNPGLEAEAVGRLAAAGVTVGWHVLPDRWCLLGATQGGLILEKVMAGLNVARHSLPQLDQAALQATRGASRVEIVPGGHDFVISGSTEPADVWRAATESVTEDVRVLSDAISDATAPRADLVVTGGWGNSEAVLAAKLRVLGSFRRTTAQEAGARGAALLAGIADGTYASYSELPVAQATRFTAEQEKLA